MYIQRQDGVSAVYINIIYGQKGNNTVNLVHGVIRRVIILYIHARREHTIYTYMQMTVITMIAPRDRSRPITHIYVNIVCNNNIIRYLPPNEMEVDKNVNPV